MNFRLNVFEIIILIINVMLLILYILNSIKLTKLRKNYSEFMTKLGKGENINEMLKIYVDEVENVKVGKFFDVTIDSEKKDLETAVKEISEELLVNFNLETYRFEILGGKA